MAEDRSTKAFKNLSQKETREKLIRDRAARLARDAAKQGITPAQLAKKKRDTYVKVVGGAASLLPIGRIISLASKGVKALTAGARTTKVAKTTKAKPSGSQTTPKPKTKAKQKSPTTAASQANRAKSQGGRSAQQAKQAPKKPAAKKTTPKKAAAKKPAPNVITALRNSPRAKRAILGGAVTSATLATIDDIRKSGKGAAVAAPMARPKRPTKKTSMSEGNTVAGSSGRRGSDPRKGFASKATPGPKKVAPTPKRKPKDKNDPRGNQVKAMSSLPAGALRKFQGSYNKKKEKLKNIGGKTYVMKR